MFKLIALAAALFGGAYVAGVFDHRYTRLVDRPPAAVLAALGDLDVRDAPGDLVAPAFRSKGVTAGLFDMVVEDELNELTRPRADPERCRALIEQWQMQQPGADAMHQDDLKDAFGDTARAMMKLSAMEQELRRNGCDTSNNGGFRPVASTMR